MPKYRKRKVHPLYICKKIAWPATKLLQRKYFWLIIHYSIYRSLCLNHTVSKELISYFRFFYYQFQQDVILCLYSWIYTTILYFKFVTVIQQPMCTRNSDLIYLIQEKMLLLCEKLAKITNS